MRFLDRATQPTEIDFFIFQGRVERILQLSFKTYFLIVLFLLLFLLYTRSRQRELGINREIVLLELDLIAVLVAHLVFLGYCCLLEGYLGVAIGFPLAYLGFEMGA